MAGKRRCFGDIRTFVTCYGLLRLTDIMAGVMKNSSLTTIERRFDLPSTITALLASSFHIGNLTMLLFVSYFGSRWHRPRALFCGAILLTVGNLIVTLPQFLGGRYEYEDISSNTSSTSSAASQCSANKTFSSQDVNCDEKEPSNQLYILLVAGMMINGVGGTPIQPLGISYIDDFAHETNSPLYLGITTSLAMGGPMIGYVLSSFFLKIWVDIGWVDTSTISITPTHPSWVGAWWLGLLVCTTGIALAMIPFPFFPKKMEKQEIKSKKESKTDEAKNCDASCSKESDEAKQKEIEADKGRKDESALSRETKEIKETVKRIFKNKIYMMTVLKFYFASASLVGVIKFFPKYLEVGFGVSAARANFLTGSISVPCVIVGTMLGSVIMKRLKLSRLGTAKLIAFSTVMATCCIAPLLFIGCDTIDIAGITVPYSNGSTADMPNVQTSCNADCHCGNGSYAPVCGSGGISYVSPCHAGCKATVVDESGKKQMFTDCSCVPLSDTSGELDVSSATPERCQFSKCSHLLKYALAMKSLASFFGGLAGTPMYIFLIRSVHEKDKAIAIGINLLLVRLLAFIPGPLIYGAAIDSACLYWGQKPCSNRAYCKVYDNASYRHRYYGIMFASNILSCITICFLYFMTKKQQKKIDEKQQVEQAKFPSEKVQPQSNGNGANSEVRYLPESNDEQETLLPTIEIKQTKDTV